MKTEHTQGIVLSRTDFGEADRIVTVITPDQGKRRLMVKGARRMKSKMAGGVELFSVSELSYIKGKGDIDTLISARLDKHYANIVQDIERVQLGYDLLKIMNRATEDQPEEDYFVLLNDSLKALDDFRIDSSLISLWFQAQLMRQAGHSPNLATDTEGHKLTAGQKYNFDYEDMAFSSHEDGHFEADQIKLLRLLFSSHKPKLISQVEDIDKILPQLAPLIQTMLQSHIRI